MSSAFPLPDSFHLDEKIHRFQLRTEANGPGIRYHGRFSSFFRNILSHLHICSPTIKVQCQQRTFYLNKKSCTKWLNQHQESVTLQEDNSTLIEKMGQIAQKNTIFPPSPSTPPPPPPPSTEPSPPTSDEPTPSPSPSTPPPSTEPPPTRQDPITIGNRTYSSLQELREQLPQREKEFEKFKQDQIEDEKRRVRFGKKFDKEIDEKLEKLQKKYSELETETGDEKHPKAFVSEGKIKAKRREERKNLQAKLPKAKRQEEITKLEAKLVKAEKREEATAELAQLKFQRLCQHIEKDYPEVPVSNYKDITSLQEAGQPLHFAVDKQDIRLLTYLIEAGADIRQKDDHNDTLFDKLLMGNPVFFDIVIKDFIEQNLIETFVNEETIVDITNDVLQRQYAFQHQGITINWLFPLIVKFANKENSAAIAHILLERNLLERSGLEELLKTGMDVDTLNKTGVTLLYTAIDKLDKDLVTTLLKYQANPKFPIEHQHVSTPIAFALARQEWLQSLSQQKDYGGKLEKLAEDLSSCNEIVRLLQETEKP